MITNTYYFSLQIHTTTSLQIHTTFSLQLHKAISLKILLSGRIGPLYKSPLLLISYLMVEISWGFIIISNNFNDGRPCYLQSSLVSDEQIQTRHIKRDQFDTIAGYPILIQMSIGLKS